VTENDSVGGFIGDYDSGTIINSFWNNISTNSNQTFGTGTNINVTSIDNNIFYFYNYSIQQFNGNWNTNIWDFYDTTLPHLAFENYVVASASAPSGSVSTVSLPSFGVGAVVLALLDFFLF
jgi:hypothetical protein